MIVTIGIDTGSGTGGIQLSGWHPGERRAAFTRAYQCDAASVPDLLTWILRSELRDTREPGGPLTRVTAAGIEAFVPARKGLKGTSPAVIRAQQRDCEAICLQYGVPVTARTALAVKQWATDDRLEKAGIAAVTNAAAMKNHARDGGRHGLFTAVQDCGLPDPLSRRGHAKLITPTTARAEEMR